MREGDQTSTLARIREKVVGVLAERVEVEKVEESAEGMVLVSIRLPDGITEHERLATQEWVQVQLWGLDSDGQVHAARYP